MTRVYLDLFSTNPDAEAETDPETGTAQPDADAQQRRAVIY